MSLMPAYPWELTIPYSSYTVIFTSLPIYNLFPNKNFADVGAGGLSNGIPELVHDSGLGATIDLREIGNADRGLSPLEIW